jgi:hypothetical protein
MVSKWQAIAEWPGPSKRAATIILTVLVTLFVGVFVVRFFFPDFGNVEGRHDVVAVGQPIEVLVTRAGNETATITVTALDLVTDEQREQWRLRPALAPVGPNDELDDLDIYLVRFTVGRVEGDLTMVPRDWRLADDADEVYPATLISTPDEADCDQFDSVGDGCAVVAVPPGTVITEVRFYGVALDRKVLVGENWAGWMIE